MSQREILEGKRAGGQASYVMLNTVLPVILNVGLNSVFQDLINGRLEDKKVGGYVGIGERRSRKCHCEGVKRPWQSQNSEISSVIFCSGTLPKRTYRTIV